MKVQSTDIFYHGSKKIFNQFDDSMSYKSNRRYVVGAFWFSSVEKIAKSYGKIIYRVTLNIEKPFVVDAKGENFSEIYLNKLPSEICKEIDRIDNKREGDTYNALAYGISRDPEFSFRFDSCDLAIAAKSAGYDSLIICNVIDAGNTTVLNKTSNIFSVFNNNQITIKEMIY